MGWTGTNELEHLNNALNERLAELGATDVEIIKPSLERLIHRPSAHHAEPARCWYIAPNSEDKPYGGVIFIRHPHGAHPGSQIPAGPDLHPQPGPGSAQHRPLRTGVAHEGGIAGRKAQSPRLRRTVRSLRRRLSRPVQTASARNIAPYAIPDEGRPKPKPNPLTPSGLNSPAQPRPPARAGQDRQLGLLPAGQRQTEARDR